ncbi:hypothetical protein LZK82_09430 [Rhizobium leguminosarum]|nr:hypothetical protein LZK82_09430 [Rhizobium leguminosarum]UIK12449.1 hypothetical protein LZK80_09460 [Rhizobium leguminosarum]UIL29448.1 hypothetical protein LZK75_09510 [Rhizobium leguminosarum]
MHFVTAKGLPVAFAFLIEAEIVGILCVSAARKRPSKQPSTVSTLNGLAEREMLTQISAGWRLGVLMETLLDALIGFIGDQPLVASFSD